MYITWGHNIIWTSKHSLSNAHSINILNETSSLKRLLVITKNKILIILVLSTTVFIIDHYKFIKMPFYRLPMRSVVDTLNKSPLTL